MPLLDPKIDVVFKALLTQYPALLRDMIECVLDLPAPIHALTVLNPDLERDLATDKGVVLDVRCELDDGRLIDLEMQVHVYPALRKRILFFWAKAYASELVVGQQHRDLRPAIVIVWLANALFAGNRFHSVFHVREDHDASLFCEDFELHFVELPKLAADVLAPERALN